MGLMITVADLLVLFSLLLAQASCEQEICVVNVHGSPIPGAWVRTFQGESGTTDPNGRIRLPLQEQRGRRQQLYYEAWAPGTLIQSAWADWGVPHVIRLQPDLGSHIQVVEVGSEQPIHGARARVLSKGPEVQDLRLIDMENWIEVPMRLKPSNEQGYIQVPGGESILLLVSADGYEDNLYLFSRFEPYDLPREPVKMHRVRPVRVRFVDGEDRPVVAAKVGFQNFHPVFGVTDDQGWLDVPKTARHGVDSMRVDAGNFYWSIDPVGYDDLVFEDEQTIVLAFTKLRGNLEASEGLCPSEFEVGTLATHTTSTSGNLNYFPQPWLDPDLIHWLPVAADGNFDLNAGWQADRVSIAVKHSDQDVVYLVQEVEGPGPHKLRLPELHLMDFKVTSDSQNRLEDAWIDLVPHQSLDEDWGRPRYPGFVCPQDRILEGGSTEFLLPDGSYTPTLFLSAGSRLKLDTFRVSATEDSVLFDLATRRVIRGTVIADRKPVFPCTVLVEGNDSSIGFGPTDFHASTDPAGNWEIFGVPDGELSIQIAPENPWLTLKDGLNQVIKPDQKQLVIEIPIIDLHFQSSSVQAFDPRKTLVQRWGVSKAGGERLNFFNDLNLSGMTNGEMRVQTTPCNLWFGTREKFGIVRPEQLELRGGEKHRIVVETLYGGGLILDAWGAPESIDLVSDWGFTPDLEKRVPGRWGLGWRDYGENSVPMAILEPGWWTIRITGPLKVSGIACGSNGCEYFEEIKGNAGTVWEGRFYIQPQQITRMKVEVDAEGEFVGMVSNPE